MRSFHWYTLAAILCAVGWVWASWGDSEKSAADSVNDATPAIEPEVAPEPDVIAVQIDGHTAFVPPGPARLPDVPENLVDAVRLGTAMLAALHLDKHKCVPEKRPQVGWQRCVGDYLVAAVDEVGALEIVEVYGGQSTAPAGFTVRCEIEEACNGGVNPPFTISAPPGWTAVAIRTAVSGDGPDGVDGATYVPYSTRLNDPELRQSGLEYLGDAVLGAYYELRAKDVRSLFIPGRYVTDFGTPDHLIALVLTEQMWSDTWFAQGSDLERLLMVDRALVTLGLNRWRSFSFSKSRTGARGVGQIMPKTYKDLRDDYPRADLPSDDVAGRTDHHASIKTMIVHTDNEWWAVKDEAHRLHLLENEANRRLVMAAGYNASIGTVVSAIQTCGENWREDDCGATCKEDPKSCVELPEETRLYLIKYEWIYGVLFDLAFRAQVEEGVWPTLYQNDQAAIAAYEERKAALAAASTTE